MKSFDTPMPTVRKSLGPHMPPVNTDLPRLPDKPSELLELAMQDLATVERDPQYRVDMRVYHRPENGLCSVCLAGAVMTRYISPKDLCSTPVGYFNGDTAGKLVALDCFRLGQLRLGLRTMIDNVPHSIKDIKVTRYDDNPAEFRSSMAHVVDMFKCANL